MKCENQNAYPNLKQKALWKNSKDDLQLMNFRS